MRLFYKQELEAAKSLIEALLTIDGGCDNPIGDGEHDCEFCAFEDGNNCGKIFLWYWKDTVTKKFDRERVEQ